MSGNQQTGSHEPDHLAVYERLPQRFRQLLAYAPSNYQAGWVHRLIKRGGDRRAYAQAVAMISLWERANTERFYGPAHPALRMRR